jgi:hypothetical protein
MKNFKKIRTLKVFSERRKYFNEDHHNIENHQPNQNVENQNVESQKSSKNTFNVLKFFDAIGNFTTSKVFFGNYLWHITFVYQGLCGVRVGSNSLG